LIDTGLGASIPRLILWDFDGLQYVITTSVGWSLGGISRTIDSLGRLCKINTWGLLPEQGIQQEKHRRADDDQHEKAVERKVVGKRDESDQRVNPPRIGTVSSASTSGVSDRR
jgi:hypothetical protein